MSISLSKDGEKELIKGLISKDITLRLYTNDIAIDKEVKFNDLMEVSGHGYNAKILKPSNWVSEDEEELLTVSHSPVEFVFIGKMKDSIIGSYATRIVNSKQTILWAERADMAPMTIFQAGDKVVISPQFRIRG